MTADWDNLTKELKAKAFHARVFITNSLCSSQDFVHTCDKAFPSLDFSFVVSTLSFCSLSNKAKAASVFLLRASGEGS